MISLPAGSPGSQQVVRVLKRGVRWLGRATNGGSSSRRWGNRRYTEARSHHRQCRGWPPMPGRRAMAGTRTKRWTVEELEQLPYVEGTRYEIVDGELLVSTQPHM